MHYLGAELHYAPDYWPLLIYAGVVVLLMLVAGYPCVIAPMLAPKTAAAHITVTISTAGDSPLALKVLLFVLLLLSGLFGHFSLGPGSATVQRIPVWFCLYWLSGLVCALINLTTGNGRHYRVNFFDW